MGRVGHEILGKIIVLYVIGNVVFNATMSLIIVVLILRLPRRLAIRNCKESIHFFIKITAINKNIEDQYHPNLRIIYD